MRLLATAGFGFSTVRFGDARAYLTAAESLVATGRYPQKTDYGAFRAPGYPTFLVAATLGDPRRIALAKIANSLLGGLSVLLLAAISERLFRMRRLAILTGAAGALDPSFVLSATDIQSEPLFLLLLLTSGLFLIVCADRPSSNAGVVAGAALGLACLTRPTALVLSPLLLAPLTDRRSPPRARGHLAASALLGFLLALAPWTIRNLKVYREIVPINDFAGVAFYLGNSDLMARFGDVQTPEQYAAWIRDLGRLAEEKEGELRKAGADSPARRLAAYVRMTAAERRANPAATRRLVGLKLAEWLRPYPNPLFWPAWIVAPVAVFYTSLTVLAIPGLARAPRRGIALFSLAVLALSMIAHLLFLVVWRYRTPYWDPILILFGLFGAWSLVPRLATQNRATDAGR